MKKDELREILSNIITPDTVFVCIGSNKFNFDAFGPLCGDQLKINNIPYFGNSEYNINGVNIIDRLDVIYNKYGIDNKNVIAIDAAVTENKSKINKIDIRIDKDCSPGAGAGKNLPKVGKHSIIMYTLLKEDLEEAIESYSNFFKETKCKDKSNIDVIEVSVAILIELITEIYNEKCNRHALNI